MRDEHRMIHPLNLNKSIKSAIVVEDAVYVPIEMSEIPPEFIALDVELCRSNMRNILGKLFYE